MKVYCVWIGMKLYKLYSDGNTIRYEGNGKFVVPQPTTKTLQNNQQAQ